MNCHSEKLLASCFLALSSAVLFFLLTGCGTDISLPDVQPTPAQVSPGAIQGSNYGGHAPLVGSRVFLMQVGTGGYGTKVTSLLSSTYSGSVFPTAQDSVAGSPTSGMYYITTSAQGFFDITGDYTCTAGEPVYLYASGGNAITSPVVNITGATGTDDTAGNLLITFTTPAGNLLYQGESVTLGAFAPTSTAYQTYAGTTHVISPLNLTTTTFAFEYGASSTTIANAAFTSTATQAGVANNPAIVNIALLGNCPTSAPYTFGTGSTKPLSIVYMNEVSTVAAAYAMAGFSAVSSSQNDAVHFGTSSTNLLGLQNAANNAGNLYDIQGSVKGTGGDGDTHIARVTTPAGNGTVPQTTINTIANILANCVDSGNTYNAATATGGTQSTQCATLFNNATSDGTLTGTKPNDTATAAINIATHPSGNTSNASFVANLFNAQTGNAPFQPSLAAKPNDFALGIKFSYTGASSPYGLATDGLGNVWVGDPSGSVVVKFSPLGAVLQILGLPGAYYPAIDQANNMWVDGAGAAVIYEYTSAGVAAAGSPYTAGGALAAPYSVTIDGRGNTIVYNATSTTAGNTVQIHGSGASATYSTYANACVYGASYYSAIGSASASYPEWTGNSGGGICGYTSTGGTINISNPGVYVLGVAIDASGNVWGQASNSTLLRIAAGTYTQTMFSGGGLTGGNPGIGVDGAGNIWAADSAAYSAGIYGISEFTNAGVPITGAGGYQAGASSPLLLTLDQSGDVWFTNSLATSSSTLEELIGAAVPDTMPLSVGSNTNKLGTRP